MIVLPPLDLNQVAVSTVTVAAIEEDVVVLAGVVVEIVARDADRADPAGDLVAADVSKGAASPATGNYQFYGPVTQFECRGCVISCLFSLHAIIKVRLIRLFEHGWCGACRVKSVPRF